MVNEVNGLAVPIPTFPAEDKNIVTVPAEPCIFVFNTIPFGDSIKKLLWKFPPTAEPPSPINVYAGVLLTKYMEAKSVVVLDDFMKNELETPDALVNPIVP